MSLEPRISRAWLPSGLRTVFGGFRRVNKSDCICICNLIAYDASTTNRLEYTAYTLPDDERYTDTDAEDPDNSSIQDWYKSHS